MKLSKISKSLMKKAVDFSLTGNANSTTCSTIYQPKAPASLKKFSKVENDK